LDVSLDSREGDGGLAPAAHRVENRIVGNEGRWRDRYQRWRDRYMMDCMYVYIYIIYIYAFYRYMYIERFAIYIHTYYITLSRGSTERNRMQSIECTSCIRLFCEPFCSTAGGGVVIAVAPAMDLFGGGTVDWVCV
jgi:hypothetical protein